MLGGVMAIIYLSVAQRGVALSRLTPREIKNALVAYGNAGKIQVREVTKRVLGVDQVKSFHAADALAVALDGFLQELPGEK